MVEGAFAVGGGHVRAPAKTVTRARELRQAMSLPEVVLWQHLRGSRFHSLRFRRQHPIGPYILDFYCPAAMLAVEVDGSAHDALERARHDAIRAAWLTERGVRQLRIPARDILDPDQLEFALAGILAAADLR
jgi:very-short-patch-repair endonuclease